ncbi:HD domain-containing phosphohydrolase [Plasticicumulans acidivorans]|uniref:HD-GYP domain-containing protein (C-di-GMP phosphodiesterase class II) n=1 Tax=Plasticicumulans acidivorans TaxID=886464 RepID=A0A317N0E1_9GAMM|nr:HD domain-containing phosphohydrolase [Plasticicumulans acidivorans]PWV65955.1 HD-GYP domain-containing protein (c-di-GMP phosphodiesterase class II) [Plasticicumulans acidivorans]
MSQSQRRHYSLQVEITVLIVVMVATVAGAVITLNYLRTAELLERAVDDYFERLQSETLYDVQGLFAPVGMAVDLLALQPIVQAKTLDERLAQARFLAATLERLPTLAALEIGYADGDFFLLRRLAAEPASSAAAAIGAPSDSRYLAQSIERGSGVAQARFVYLDAGLQVLRSDERPDYAALDPRTRPWYRAALAATPGRRAFSGPYRYFLSDEVGQTVALHSTQADAVVAADITLQGLSAHLGRSLKFADTQIAVLDAAGRVLAQNALAHHAALARSDAELPRIDMYGASALSALVASAVQQPELAQRAHAFSAQGRDWRGVLVPLESRGAPGYRLAVAVPVAVLLADARALLNHGLLLALLIAVVAMLLGLLLARLIARPLQALAREADAIRRFEFAAPVAVGSVVSEVDALAETLDRLKRTIRSFLDLSVSTAAEPDFERLTASLLAHTLDIAAADAGLLYFLDERGDAFEVVGARLRDGRALELSARFSTQEIERLLVQPGGTQAQWLAAEAAPEHLQPLFAALGAGRLARVPVPLHDRSGTLLGGIVLFLGHVPDPAQLDFIRALSGTAAIALEARQLIRAQKALFDALIKLLADAIDAKSPYTGGHCARVPVLAEMLARAACAEREGPFAGFTLSPSEWEALHVAAWLHDCGKVTTPEYVVDKATKLETLYDRLHEVRMRFEVLKRDAEIDYWRARADGADDAAASARRDAAWQALDDDFAFVARCNQGGEFLARAAIERLQAIARRTWRRTLDDRIGLSQEELARKARMPAPPLPVDEPLLADRPEHRIERGERECIAPDNPWGFRVEVPELLYDRGELKNLCVERGTISAEERFKINGHMIETIRMLERLPFPRHLRAVPEIAGGHHETMDGTGYPRRLRGEQMSVLARMMAIADIFEALTAADRPYKPGKKLSEALAIMARMRDAAHIDGELFALFLRAGVWRDYAAAHVAAGQIDNVDIAAYLRRAGGTDLS